jgi:hypothetical protein
MPSVSASTKLQMLARRKRVAELAVQGWTQIEIAAELGVSQGTISTDLKAVRKMWAESAVIAMDEMKATEKAKLDYIEREAFGAWDRSKGERETKSIKTDGESEEKALKSEAQFGDPRYLTVARQVISDRVELFGLASPKKIQIKDVTDRPTDALEARYKELLIRALESEQTESIGEHGAEDDSDGAGEALSAGGLTAAGAGAGPIDGGGSSEGSSIGETMQPA